MLEVYEPLPQYSTDKSPKSLRTYVYSTQTSELLGYVINYEHGGYYSHLKDGTLIKVKPTGSMFKAIKRFIQGT